MLCRNGIGVGGFCYEIGALGNEFCHIIEL